MPEGFDMDVMSLPIRLSMPPQGEVLAISQCKELNLQQNYLNEGIAIPA